MLATILHSKEDAMTTLDRYSRRTLGNAGLVGMAACLAGCAFERTAATPDAQTAANGPKVLRLATGFAIASLDPNQHGFWGNEFGYSELMLEPSPDGRPKPWVLRSVEAQSPTTWRLTLHDGVRFQNGKPLTADRLAAAMTFQLTDNVVLRSLLAGATVRAEGPTTLVVTTSQPVPDLPNVLADESHFKVYDHEAFEAAGRDPAKLLDARIYTGPYIPTELNGTKMVLKADPQHWGGRPALDGVEILFVPEASARIKAVQNNEADLALYPPTQANQTLKGVTTARFVAGAASGPTFQWPMNHRRGPFADAQVRNAVLAIIDQRALAAEVMQGMYEPADGLYAPEMPWARPIWSHDPARAESLLTAANYTKGPDGKWMTSGGPLTITVLTYPQQPDSDVLALAVQAQLKPAGIGMTIRQVPDVNAAIKSGVEWDAAVLGNGMVSFGGSPLPPLLTNLHSKGSRNHGQIQDPELDQLIDRASVTTDETQRHQLLGAIQQRVGEQAHIGYLGRRKAQVVTGRRMAGYQPPNALMWVTRTTGLG